MDKYFTIMDGITKFLPQEGSELLKAGRFFVTYDAPNESIYYCPEDGKIVQLGGGVGKKTAEGGEIFNDYENNKALSQFSSARGLNTQAGNKAFKITNIEQEIKETFELSESMYLDHGIKLTADAKAGIYKYYRSSYQWGLNMDGSESDYWGTEIRYELINNETGEIVAEFYDDGVYSYDPATDPAFEELGEFGEYFYIESANVGETVTSVKVPSSLGEQPTGNYIITVKGNVTSGETPYEVGDIAQILCKTDVNNSYKISAISEDGTIITVTKTDNRIVQPPKIHPTDPENKRNWFYVSGKNGGEICPALVAPIVSGIDSIATGYGATAMGVNTLASGYYATAFGRKTKAAYAGTAGGEGSEAGNNAVALGNYVSALGDGSVATGTETQARAASSRAGGRYSRANSEYSVAEGLNVVTHYEVPAQVVFGRYNRATNDSLFIIGNGTSDDKRTNAVEVRLDGTVWILDGTERLATFNEINAILPGRKVTGNGTLLSIYGSYTTATGIYSLASGYSKATEQYSTALGWGTASGQYSFASGYDSKASGYAAVAFGYKTTATEHSQFVVGRHNLASSALFIVGNGVISTEKKSNAFEVYGNGSAWLQRQGQDPNSVVIKSYVDDMIKNSKDSIKLTDTTTKQDYKLYISNGKLQIEEVAE